MNCMAHSFEISIYSYFSQVLQNFHLLNMIISEDWRHWQERQIKTAFAFSVTETIPPGGLYSLGSKFSRFSVDPLFQRGSVYRKTNMHLEKLSLLRIKIGGGGRGVDKSTKCIYSPEIHLLSVFPFYSTGIST